MEQDVLVTTYCTAYNHEKYIRDALDGFVMQKTDFRHEVIVHDDASTDGTADIIREYAKAYPDIIKPVFQTENQYSKNVKIFDGFIKPLIKGKYTAICEGDDYWADEGKLQKQADFLESHPEYVACAHNSVVLYLNNGKKELRNTAARDYDCDVKEMLARIAEGKREAWQLSGLMYRSDCLSRRPAFFNAPTTFGDMSLDLFLLSHGKVRFMAEPMSVYRRGTETSLMRQADAAHARMDGEIIELLERFDEYSGHRYTDELQVLILQSKYNQAYRAGRCRELLRGEYRELYRHKPVLHRIRVCAMAYVPHIYGIIHWMLALARKVRQAVKL